VNGSRPPLPWKSTGAGANARYVPYEAAELQLWARAVWPLAKGDPDSGGWADAYAVALAEAARPAAPAPAASGGERASPWAGAARRAVRRLARWGRAAG
jgi:hypothetical protein